MSKKKGTIYLTEEQMATVKKMEEDKTDEILDTYANQAYNYGIDHGVTLGMILSAFSLLGGVGISQLFKFIAKRKK